jgi:hypothetical protein
MHADIRDWAREDFCLIDKRADIESASCPQAVYCDQAFRDVMLAHPTRERKILARGYTLGTLWDLIKILSYFDLSPFKKAWAMLACWRLAKRLQYM